VKFYLFADAWTCVYRLGLPVPGAEYVVETGTQKPASYCSLRSALQAARNHHTGLTADGLARLDALIRRETLAAKVVA
jgi:hypothetical protein